VKYNLIKFSNGKYGVRRYNEHVRDHEFYDYTIAHWWPNANYRHCQTDEEQARIILEELRNPNSPPTYEVIK